MFSFNFYYIRASCFSEKSISFNRLENEQKVLLFYEADGEIEYGILIFESSTTTII